MYKDVGYDVNDRYEELFYQRDELIDMKAAMSEVENVPLSYTL